MLLREIFNITWVSIVSLNKLDEKIVLKLRDSSVLNKSWAVIVCNMSICYRSFTVSGKMFRSTGTVNIFKLGL